MVDKKEEVINFNFHRTLYKMWRTPSEFFKTEKNKGYQVLLRMFVLFYVFYSLILQIVSLYSGQISIFDAVVGFVIGIIFAVVLAFLFSGLMHIVLILFGGKGDYFNTYKAGIYTLVLWTFYSILLLIISLFIQFDAQGLQLALANIQDSSEVPSLVIDFLKSNPSSLIILLISIGVHIHVLVFGIKALAHYQKISKVKAGFVVVIVALAFIVIQSALIAYVVSQSGIPAV